MIRPQVDFVVHGTSHKIKRNNMMETIHNSEVESEAYSVSATMPVVSPVRGQNDERPSHKNNEGTHRRYDSDDSVASKRNKSSKYSFKKYKDVSPRNFMSSASGAYMISLKGNIDLFYFEQGQNEVFVNPLVQLLFGENNKQVHGYMAKKEALLKATNIVAVVPRRMNLQNDEPQWKINQNNKGKFKKHYLIRFDPTLNPSKESKKKALEALVSVRYKSRLSMQLLYVD